LLSADHCDPRCIRVAARRPEMSGAFFANIDVHLWHFIRRGGCCDLQNQEQPGWGHPQAQAGTFASKAMTTSPPEHMHYANPVSAGQRQWHEHDLRRSVEFHAVLLAMAGHDLRQHLQIISGTFGWLSARTQDDIDRKRIDRGQRAVMQIAEQLHQLVTALHIHQKSSQLVSVPVRLSSLFSAVQRDVSEFASEKGVQLRVVQTQAVIASELVLLGSIMSNLVRNAVKFTEEGGQVLLGCRRHGSRIRIEVHDTGVGMAPKQLENIFEAFHRLEPARSDGLGLGLFVVNRAAELLQHEIEVRSTVGRGSCFTLVANAANCT
jgi:two-component system, OmpR family, phosphate regulon sensor histidine kinase PhoR